MAKPKVQAKDVWESDHRRSTVVRIEKYATGNRVYYTNKKADGQQGREMSAFEYVFVRRKLVERDGREVIATGSAPDGSITVVLTDGVA